MDEQKERLLDEIAQREWEMFQASPDDNGQVEFQDRPEIFKLTRRMAHSAHDKEFLESYLDDLRDAEAKGRNFMREKYARLAQNVQSARSNTLLDGIADAEMDFLNQAARLYPEIIRHSASADYRRYLRSELETMSPQTLELYAEEIRDARKKGHNPALERHNWLAAHLGKPLLATPE